MFKIENVKSYTNVLIRGGVEKIMVNLTEEEKLELGIYIEQVIHEEIQKIIKKEAINFLIASFL